MGNLEARTPCVAQVWSLVRKRNDDLAVQYEDVHELVQEVGHVLNILYVLLCFVDKIDNQISPESI